MNEQAFLGFCFEPFRFSSSVLGLSCLYHRKASLPSAVPIKGTLDFKAQISVFYSYRVLGYIA